MANEYNEELQEYKDIEEGLDITMTNFSEKEIKLTNKQKLDSIKYKIENLETKIDKLEKAIRELIVLVTLFLVVLLITLIF